MLRPERMSRVSVTGSKQVLDESIVAIHELRLLHMTDYDGGYEGFDPGDPIEGADEASERLVTVRSLQSILGVTGDEIDSVRIVDDDELAEELEAIRVEVNEHDDRRDELRDELRAIEDRIDSVEPFAALGIDLDLLRGYDTLSVAVGEGDADRVRDALERSEIDTYELYEEEGVVAVFARTDDLSDVLVDAEFTAYEVPDAESNPDQYLAELREERDRLRSRLEAVEEELDELRTDVGGFLLAAEEKLLIRVQRQEAPLSFATTENAFVAEGWIPTERFVDLAEGLYEEVGDHVEVDEIERAQYDGEGRIVDREDVGGAPGTPDPTATDGGEELITDGGRAGADDDSRDRDQNRDRSRTEEAVRSDGGSDIAAERGTHGRRNVAPPVIQQNPDVVKPFEALVQVINRPKYSELDPTVIVFLTFPLFFGVMIGDLGYGLLYMGIGYYLYSNMEGDVLRSLGGVALLAGASTALFGVLYGEIFGLHVLGEVLFGGSPPLHKGLQPAELAFAQFWLTMSILFGLAHITIGYVFDFYENLDHGIGHAVAESGSWLIMMFGLWGWIFSDALRGTTPGFMVGEESVFNGHPFDLGFTGLPAFDLFQIPGTELYLSAWVVVFLLGLVLLVSAEPVEAIESLNVLVNVLSYARLAAVLLAKAGMAFVVNLLVFGAYRHDGEFHFIWPDHSLGEIPAQEVMFAGLISGEGAVSTLIGAVAGIVILVVGHALVLVLGITSAGLQAVRLEYVEFFGKFYEGGGEPYSPFGHERQYTTKD